MSVRIQQRASILLQGLKESKFRLNFEGKVRKADLQKSYADHQALRKPVDNGLAVIAEAKKNITNVVKAFETAEDQLEANWRALLAKSSREQGDSLGPYFEEAGHLASLVGGLKTLAKSLAGNFGNIERAAQQYQQQKAKVVAGYNEGMRYVL